MKRILSVLMSLVLVIGLCPGLAYGGEGLSAGRFSDDSPESVLTQARKGFVADRVYALIGNKYAMMVTEKNNVQTIDIIDANYKSTLKMSSEVALNEYGAYELSPKSTYQYAGLTANGVVATSKSSGKKGLLSYAGKQLIPCSYESLRENESGKYILGEMGNSDGTGTIKVFSGKTGKVLASANIGNANYYFSAYWSGANRVNVSRSYSEGSNAKRLDEVYSFNGKKLKRISSKEYSGLDYYVIAPSIVIRYDKGSTEYYTSAKSSGKLIKSLSGWHYEYVNLKGKYLFSSPDKKSAKLVDEKAKTVATFSTSSEQFYWGSAGDYVYCSTSYKKDEMVTTVFSFDGKKKMTLPKGQDFHMVLSGGTARYYSSREVSVNSAGGAKLKTQRPVKFFDEKLKTLKNAKPALGMYLSVINGKGAYDSGRDKDGNLNTYVGYRQGSPDVVAADGKAIKCGKFTLSRPVRGVYGYISKSDLQFASKDAYTAKNSSGKFGLVSLKGKVVVPFNYNDVFCGASGSRTLSPSNNIMVKKNGAWSFLSVS